MGGERGEGRDILLLAPRTSVPQAGIESQIPVALLNLHMSPSTSVRMVSMRDRV